MTSNRSLDRRLNNIQFNVQQNINIIEERIQNNQKYYQQLQSEISNAEDLNNRLAMKIAQVKHLEKGKVINKVTAKETIKSRLISDHNRLMKEIEKEHNMKISAMKEDFENTYDQIDKSFDQRLIEKCKPFEIEIKRTIDLINKTKAQNAQVDNSIDEGAEQEVERTHELENMRIQSLEAKLKEQNQDRLSSLLESKKQIQECLHHLEEMENTHISKMDQLKNQLDNIDENYKEQLRRCSEKQSKEITDIKRNIKDAQESLRSVTKSLNQTQKRQKNEIGKMNQESELLRTELLTIKKKEKQKREDNEIQNYQKRMSELNSKLKERESVLLKVRADNETLKKEIARISQERQIAKRRAALHIT